MEPSATEGGAEEKQIKSPVSTEVKQMHRFGFKFGWQKGYNPINESMMILLHDTLKGPVVFFCGICVSWLVDAESVSNIWI